MQIHNKNVADYKQLKGIAQYVIKDAAQSYWHDYCDTLNSSTKLSTVWNMARRMNGIQANIANKHLIDSQGQIIDSNADKAELLARNYAEVSS